MDSIDKGLSALRPISGRGIPVRQGWYDARLGSMHITLWLLSDRPDSASDDAEEVRSETVQVNIWSKADQTDLKKEVKDLMKKAGFLFLEARDEAETDTRIFINAMRFLLLQEESEE